MIFRGSRKFSPCEPSVYEYKLTKDKEDDQRDGRSHHSKNEVIPKQISITAEYKGHRKTADEVGPFTAAAGRVRALRKDPGCG